jgi:hypothetical protein
MTHLCYMLMFQRHPILVPGNMRSPLFGWFDIGFVCGCDGVVYSSVVAVGPVACAYTCTTNKFLASTVVEAAMACAYIFMYIYICECVCCCCCIVYFSV